MIIRRRRVRIEIEQAALHVETKTESLGPADPAPCVRPEEALPHSALPASKVEKPAPLPGTANVPHKQENLK